MPPPILGSKILLKKLTGGKSMSKIGRFIMWICSKFTRQEIEQIILGLQEILKNRNPEIKPKDEFKEKYPNYRNFYVDPNPPLTENPKQLPPTKNYKILLKEYQTKHGKPLTPVSHRDKSLIVPKKTICPHCEAPSRYLYYNNGKKKSQLFCKSCRKTFQLEKRFRNKTKYFCPYCSHALFKWKEQKDATIYKCCNDNCPLRISNLNKLNPAERLLQKLVKSQFKLNYQYREYHYKINELTHSSPSKAKVNLTKIHNSLDTLGLILTFYVSFAINARKTSLILKDVFNIPISYQTVLNYAEASAYYCHQFNLKYKGAVDDIQTGDEAYIKINGKHFYVFFFLSSKNLKITSYHLADSRDVLPATISMLEAIRTAHPDQQITLITDGNPSYPAGILFINSHLPSNPDIKHHKVIGLQNLDAESEKFRPFKELIERFNRTFKYHVKPSYGFNSPNGAFSLITLVVTHYNFLRPHMSLKYKTPIQLKDLESISTIQGKWAKILSLAA